MREALEPVSGFVWELTLPRGPDGRIKGFAFASFTCQAHAQKAIDQVNNKKTKDPAHDPSHDPPLGPCCNAMKELILQQDT